MVGALAVAECAREHALSARVGGCTWERRPIDPIPGPRRLDEIAGAEPIAAGVALAAAGTAGPGGFRFAEAHMARVLGEPTVLVDPNGGPRAIAAGLDAAADRLGCDLVALVDVGGDVLAHGDEPGLASPLCDAVFLAASAHMRVRTVGAVFGPGCDGELTQAEVVARIEEMRAQGGQVAEWRLAGSALDRVEAAVAEVPTEASAMAVRAARGESGRAEIRGGRRTVALGPIAATTYFFDPASAIAGPAWLAAAVLDAGSLEEAHEILTARGLRTELAYERNPPL